MKKISLALLLLLLVLSGCTKKEAIDFQSINPQNDVYYEIFVRSFADSDNDGIGDLNGVTENLDYLEALGVTGIWLMPINVSNSYHGYDVLDYYDIDSDYGTMADFENLIDEATSRGITIMIDLVINHTSDQHDWFIKSRANNPEFRDYYIWEGTTAFSSFVGGMVDLNLANEDVKSEIKNIFDFYLEKGVRGFRLDAAKHFFDKPGVAGVTLKNAFFMMEMNAYIKETYPDSFITAEVYEPNYEFNVDYYLGSDSILDFTVQRAIQERIGVGSSTYLLASTFEKVFNAYRKVDPGFVASPFITNHDMDRIASMSGFNGAQGMARMKLAANVLLTLPG
ncbi:MAG: alpha-amylase, partial [Tenericutes bacterium HGW-Tenericutes-8]